MPAFGSASRAQLATCHPRLQMVLNEAIKYFDFVVVEGHRGKEAQNKAYAKGLSQLPWPRGNHNKNPSTAADIAPYPVDWAEGEKRHLRFAFMQGVVHACAKKLGVKVRFGMDWNRNLDPRDERFLDLPHVELDENV
jgi:peptidoglycan L-alanyl-D-glutamate endopeptidase CwlK